MHGRPKHLSEIRKLGVYTFFFGGGRWAGSPVGGGAGRWGGGPVGRVGRWAGVVSCGGVGRWGGGAVAGWARPRPVGSVGWWVSTCRFVGEGRL